MLRKIVQLFVVLVVAAMLVRPFIIKPVYIGDQEEEAKQKQPVIEVEKPLHNIALPEFSSIRDVNMKKQAFFSFIRPAVEEQNALITKERQQIKALVEQLHAEPSIDSTTNESNINEATINEANTNEINTIEANTNKSKSVLTNEQLAVAHQLAKKYRIKAKNLSNEQLLAELLLRVDVIPTPLVLVQAANESAWGTSRFARIGLNFFGIWCYSPGCGMVPRSRNHGANHEVEAFQSVDDAVKRYLHNINTNNAYQVFRTIRKQLREQSLPLSPEVLATGLLAYSERGGDYIVEITDMLRHNEKYLAPSSSE